MDTDVSKELTVLPTPPPESDVIGSGDVFKRANSVVVESAKYLATEFTALDRHQRLKLVKAFRAELIPRQAPGRKRRKEITAAYADWKQGMKGLALFREHIYGYAKLSHWRRREKSRALMDAIRSRRRRERKRGESRTQADS